MKFLHICKKLCIFAANFDCMKRFLYLLVCLCVCLNISAEVKYVFYLIGDGMGPNEVLAAEMYLAEAEARCHKGGQDTDVQNLLKEVNKNLDPSYACTKTGADLLKEVKLYRRIDLWGEGFDWFDYKRWNEPIVRKSIADGGSFAAAFAVTINVGDGNKWTWKIPKKETDYNDLILPE